MNFEKQMDDARTEAAQITCWCLTIALHQDFGVGASRLEKLAAKINELEDANILTMMQHGTREADEQRIGWMQGKTETSFQVPLIRAPRGRKEQQLRMARDDAASTAWQVYAAACIAYLGFGPERLERLRQTGRDNYAQFNCWAQENGIEVAMEWLKRCAEDALKEECRVVDNDESGWNKLKGELRTTQRLVARAQLSNEIVKPGAQPAADEQGAIFARCMAETLAAGRRRPL